MKILMIGNGFDLEHGLPTKYTDFLTFIAQFQDISKRLETVTIKEVENTYFYSLFCDKKNTKIVNALTKLTTGNMWIKYFQTVYQSHMESKENWIDFESEISDIIQTLDYAIKFYKDESSFSNLPQDAEVKLKRIVKEKRRLEKKNIGRCVKDLLWDLDKLICTLEIYICECIMGYYGGNIAYYNPDINEIYPDAVLSFNYSDTYRKIYAYNRSNIKYDFIHGKAKNNLSQPLNINTLIEKCNLVLGIDEYLPDDRKSKEIDFIAFKKYYQRIYKQTGNQYKKWLEQIDRNVKEGRKEENILYIFGHSLDETDGDVLRDLINHDRVKTIVYYKDKKMLGQLIANLVKILGSDKVIEKVYGNMPSIQFVQQRRRKKIEGSSFEIVSDIAKLEQIYKLHSNDAQDILNKINQKIKNQSLEYFCSQREVISLYDALQRIGLETQYLDRLLNIAYKLLRCKGLKQAEKYDSADWGHVKYDNSTGCGVYTFTFIMAVNEYNKKNFLRDKEYQETIFEELENIKKLISEKKDMDKRKFTEIISRVFRMFQDKSVNTEELWNVLLKMAVGPAEKIAKETLKELKRKSPNPLDIVRYQHLLSEIEASEYFAMQDEAYMED